MRGSSSQGSSSQDSVRKLLVEASDGGCRSCDHYEKEKKIGEGTYGAVFLAKCKQTKRLVALKKLKLESESEGFPITSIRETITLLKGKHPNIIEVIEIVFGDRLDQIYIVMEYMELDLKTFMHNMKRPFDIKEIKLLAIQLIRAVDHLHNNWILHRDIKPSNLLINKGVLKLADFGLAREYGSPLRQYTQRVVTLWYRAVELLLNAGKYSTAIDIWSVGCIFGELFTNKPLFPGNSEQEQITLIYQTLGSPNDESWPDYDKIKLTSKMNLPYYRSRSLKDKLTDKKIISESGLNLWTRLLAYDPGVRESSQIVYSEKRKAKQRISAEEALKHKFFTEEPIAVHPNLFYVTSSPYF